MKTLRFALIAVIVSCTMVSLASTDGFKAKPKFQKKAINITLTKAISIPGLVTAMFEQLNPSFLAKEEPVYVKDVSHNGNIYRITGTYAQWKKFFSNKWKLPYEAKPVFGTN